MKRAGRIVYRLLSGLSLLLLLATAGVWVRSYWVSDRLIWYDWPEDGSFEDLRIIWCSRGGVRIDAHRALPMPESSWPLEHFVHRRSPATKYPAWGDEQYGDSFPITRRIAFLGFEWLPKTYFQHSLSSGTNYVLTSLTLPLYFPCLLFAILPAHYLLRVRRRRRIARRIALGCCIHCGYDLRASSGRCPECGEEQ